MSDIPSASDEAKKMMARMLEAVDGLKSQHDNLLKAIAMLAASGNIQIIEGGLLKDKPVIMLPTTMYLRMIELYAEKKQ